MFFYLLFILLFFITVYCIFILYFILYQYSLSKTDNISFILSQNQVYHENNKFFNILFIYLKLLLLELPRSLFKNLLLSFLWNKWNKERTNSSSFYINITVNNIKILLKKQQLFNDFITSNIIIDNNNNQIEKQTLLPNNFELLILPYSLIIGKIQLILLSKLCFPLPILGAVHVSNEFTLLESFNIKKEVNIDIYVHNFKKQRSGILFTMDSIIYQDNKCVWKCSTKLLSRGRFSNKFTNKQDNLHNNISMKEFTNNINESLYNNDSNTKFLQFKGNTGRIFANICSDYNPIHISPLLAKCFGFKKCIIHGICAYSKALSQIEYNNFNINTLPLYCNVNFVSPLFIPSTVCIKYRETNDEIILLLIPKNYDHRNQKPFVSSKISNKE